MCDISSMNDSMNGNMNGSQTNLIWPCVVLVREASSPSIFTTQKQSGGSFPLISPIPLHSTEIMSRRISNKQHGLMIILRWISTKWYLWPRRSTRDSAIFPVLGRKIPYSIMNRLRLKLYESGMVALIHWSTDAPTRLDFYQTSRIPQEETTPSFRLDRISSSETNPSGAVSATTE